MVTIHMVRWKRKVVVMTCNTYFLIGTPIQSYVANIPISQHSENQYPNIPTLGKPMSQYPNIQPHGLSINYLRNTRVPDRSRHAGPGLRDAQSHRSRRVPGLRDTCTQSHRSRRIPVDPGSFRYSHTTDLGDCRSTKK